MASDRPPTPPTGSGSADPAPAYNSAEAEKQATKPVLPTIVTSDSSNKAPAAVTTPTNAVPPIISLSPAPGDSNAPSTPPAPSGSISGTTAYSDVAPGSPSSSAPGSPQDYKTSLALRDNNPEKMAHHRRPSGGTIETVLSSADGNGPAGVPAAAKVNGDLEEGGKAADVQDEKEQKKPGALAKLPLVGRLFGGKKKEAAVEESEDGSEDSDEKGDKKKKEKKPTPMLELPDPEQSVLDESGFGVPPNTLSRLVADKDAKLLEELGGTTGVLEKLRVADGGKNGIPDGEHEQGNPSVGASKRGDGVYGVNRLPERRSKHLWELMWAALKDKVLILLLIAATVSLALGLYQDLGTEPEVYYDVDCPEGCSEPQVDWVEGVAILIAVAIVVLVGSLNDYSKERQFRALNSKKDDREVIVVRNGQEGRISVYDLVVGDTLVLNPGDIVPVDGLLLSGSGVKCDESAATGESDEIKKVRWEDLRDRRAAGGEEKHTDSFLLSGAKVADGTGKCVVVAVGQRSFHGRLMWSLQQEDEETAVTPLQMKLNRLAELIAKLGTAAGLVLFFSLMIRFFVQLGTRPNRTPNEKGESFIQILIISVTLIVVAVPEGLPLAVTLALAFATRRMMSQNLLVRVLASCETMANTTVVCTDKTGTLTQNEMTVVAGSIGIHCKFVRNFEENKGRENANKKLDAEQEKDIGNSGGGARDVIIEASEEQEKAAEAAPAATEGLPPAEPAPAEGRTAGPDFALDMSKVPQVLTPRLVRLMNDSVAVNSQAFIDPQTGAVVGHKTEGALLGFGSALSWPSYSETREKAEVAQLIPFSSTLKASIAVIKLRKEDGDGYRVLVKGAPDILTKRSNRHIVVKQEGEQGAGDDTEIKTSDFTDESWNNIERTIIFYNNQCLRTLALCYKDVSAWPPKGVKTDETGEVDFQDLARGLTLIGIVAIEDPLREGVAKAVETSQNAGVAIKMCTGDNILTARSIAAQCGIFSKGGVIMEGPAFRAMEENERLELLPRLQVLARCSPHDKETLVAGLQKLGHVVGVTGDGTNDGPALKKANVGFSMGIAGTEVAKEASDIILMDDNFRSIVVAIMWGRCINDSVKKFLQFQISVNIVAVIVTFVSAVSSEEEESVLTAVQLLWVNLIMDTFAALALATDPATPESLKRKPDRKMAPLITVDMWKLVIGQAAYQTICIFVLHYAGKSILNMNGTSRTQIEAESALLSTLVFNTFVFCQIFNQLNARELGRRLWVFRGFWKNYYFMIIFAIMVAGQILIVEFGGAAFQVTRLHGREWGISLVLGALCIPWAVVIRLIPTKPIEDVLVRLRLFPDPNALPSESPQSEERRWNEGITKTLDNLATFSQIRGGRMRSSSIVRKSRTRQLQKHDIHPHALMAMVPTLVGASVGAGWKPEPVGGSLSDPASADPSTSSSALWRGGIQVHPETDAQDPVAKGLEDKLSGQTLPPTRWDKTHRRTPSGASRISQHSRNNSLTVQSPGLLSPPSPAR